MNYSDDAKDLLDKIKCECEEVIAECEKGYISDNLLKELADIRILTQPIVDIKNTTIEKITTLKMKEIESRDNNEI